MFRKKSENAGIDHKKLFAEANTAMLVADVGTGVLLECNRAAEELTGRSRKDLIGAHQSELTAGEEKERYLAMFRQHVRLGAGSEFGGEVIGKGGERVPVIINFKVTRMGGRRVIIGAFIDISERKRIEKELEEKERLYRLLAENASDIIWMLGLDFRFRYVSPSVERVLGYSPGEVLGKRGDHMLTPGSARKARKIFRKTAEAIKSGEKIKEPYVMELEYFRKDGPIMWAESSATLQRDEKGRPKSVIGVTRDITARKESERLLSESEKRYHAMVHNIPGMLYRAGADWRVEVAAGTDRIAGYSADDLTGGKVRWRDIINEDDRDRVFREGSGLAEAGPVELVQEYRVTGRDNEVRWVSDHKLARFSDDGKFLGVDGIVFDITDRKKAEEEIKKKLHQLEVFHKAAVGRELKMKKLEERVAELEAEAGGGRK